MPCSTGQKPVISRSDDPRAIHGIAISSSSDTSAAPKRTSSRPRPRDDEEIGLERLLIVLGDPARRVAGSLVSTAAFSFGRSAISRASLTKCSNRNRSVARHQRARFVQAVPQLVLGLPRDRNVDDAIAAPMQRTARKRGREEDAVGERGEGRHRIVKSASTSPPASGIVTVRRGGSPRTARSTRPGVGARRHAVDADTAPRRRSPRNSGGRTRG